MSNTTEGKGFSFFKQRQIYHASLASVKQRIAELGGPRPVELDLDVDESTQVDPGEENRMSFKLEKVNGKAYTPDQALTSRAKELKTKKYKEEAEKNEAYLKARAEEAEQNK